MSLIDFDVHCVRCGTNLRALDSREACRLCKLPVAETLGLTDVDPSELRISGDLACTGCGYNLRTLHANSVCPECGKPIAPTLSPDPLRRAGRGWLNAMRRGLSLLVVVTLLFWLIEVVSCLSSLSFVFRARFMGWPLFFLQQGCYILWCVAVYRVTCPEPRRPDSPGIGHWGHWARAAAMVQVGCHLTWYAYMVGASQSSTGQFSLLPILDGVPGLARICARAALFATFVMLSATSWMLLFAYLRQLARRAGRKADLMAALICLFGLQGILQAIQYGPLFLLMLCQNSRIWPSLNVFEAGTRDAWQAAEVLLTLFSAFLLILAVVAILRFKGIIKGAAEGRFLARVAGDGPGCLRRMSP